MSEPERATPGELEEAIAVIGMACRFPGARNVDAFWENLRQGVESISFFTAEELAESGVTAEALADPCYVRAGGHLEGADLFDAEFFGIPAEEASLTDPQHRLLLECARTALDDAGYGLEAYEGLVGIYAGVGLNRYLLSTLAERYRTSTPARCQELVTLNDKDYAVTRVAFRLGLSGPAVSVQTASSTSLVAIHVACESLRHGECDMALAGGVSLHALGKSGYFTNDGMVRSPDGHTRTFDAKARGTVPGSGVGLVVLKRLEDALADGDSVLAVVRGSTVNNDGGRRPSYAVPSQEGQADLVAEALAVARVEPSTVSYVEAHGSGTPMGDAIEVAALGKVFRKAKPGSCALGSVHPNVGHLGVAAGVAGFIKTVLQLSHRQLVPTLHFERPNPNIDLSRTPFYVNVETTEWLTDGAPRVAGVSSFGLGGTNAHVVLQEAPPEERGGPPPRSRDDRVHVLPISARSPAALRSLARATLDWLSSSGRSVPLADVCYTAGVRRSPHDHRLALAFRSSRELTRLLEAALREEPHPGLALGTRLPGGRVKVAFVFPPRAGEPWQLVRDLARNEPAYRAALERGCGVLERLSGWSLGNALDAKGTVARLAEPEIREPLLLATQLALVALWGAWGVEPDAVAGLGTGEVAAACAAGALGLDDAVEVAWQRGRLLQRAKDEGMVLGEEGTLPGDGTGPLADELARALRGIEPRAPGTPVLSALEGAASREGAFDGAHWGRALHGPAHLGRAVDGLLDLGCNAFLEAGLRPVLAKGVADRIGEGKREGHVPPSPGFDGEDPRAAAAGLGFLWTLGYPVDWRKHAGQGRAGRLVRLPAYPFERRRYWAEPVGPGPGSERG